MPNAVTLSLWLTLRRRCWRRSPSGLSRGGVIGEFVDHRVEQDIHDHSDS
jgi:hypothetical protein